MKFKHFILGIMVSMLLVSCGNESSSSITNSSNSGSVASSSDNNSSGSSSSTASSHTHTFASGWEHDETYHWHKSTCGHDVVSGKTEHSFKEEVITPTHDEGGYTIHTCTICDYSYKDALTPSQEEHNKNLGITPVFRDDNTTVTYGLYPQTHVNDAETLAALDALTSPESNDWYLYSGSYYAKKSATTKSAGSNYSDYSFSDGTAIVNGTTYWFKCEPIEWKVLFSSEKIYSLISTILLDAHRYYHSSYDERIVDGKTIYPNNYKYSDIRSWLIDDFYNSAFALGNSLIQTVTVDNSVATTGHYSTNKYACEDTEDKVYLLSYADYNNVDYFADDAARCCKPTDWAKASGIIYDTNGTTYTDGSTDYSNLGNSPYWTRSPVAGYKGYAWRVNMDGYIYDNYTDVDYSNRGVRPAITIKL